MMKSMKTKTAGKLIRRKDFPELNADQIIWKGPNPHFRGRAKLLAVAYETSKQVQIS